MWSSTCSATAGWKLSSDDARDPNAAESVLGSSVWFRIALTSAGPGQATPPSLPGPHTRAAALGLLLLACPARAPQRYFCLYP